MFKLPSSTSTCSEVLGSLSNLSFTRNRFLWSRLGYRALLRTMRRFFRAATEGSGYFQGSGPLSRVSNVSRALAARLRRHLLREKIAADALIDQIHLDLQTVEKFVQSRSEDGVCLRIV